MTSYTPHWTAELLPPMDEEGFAALKADIKQHGQVEPIVLWRNQIVDGRHRYRACRDLGIEPNFENLSEDMTERDVFARALSRNVIRRHLSTGQKALIAHDLLHGDAAANLETRMTVAQAAALLGVSDSAVNMMTAALKKAPHVRDEVSNGKLTINAASDLADLAVDEPEAAAEALEAVREAPTPKAAKKVATRAIAAVRESKKKEPLKGKPTAGPRVKLEDQPGWVVELFHTLAEVPSHMEKEPPSAAGLIDLVEAIYEVMQMLREASYENEEA